MKRAGVVKLATDLEHPSCIVYQRLWVPNCPWQIGTGNFSSPGQDTKIVLPPTSRIAFASSFLEKTATIL